MYPFISLGNGIISLAIIPLVLYSVIDNCSVLAVCAPLTKSRELANIAYKL